MNNKTFALLEPTKQENDATTDIIYITTTHFPVPFVDTTPAFSCLSWIDADHRGPGVCSYGTVVFSSQCKQLSSWALLYLTWSLLFLIAAEKCKGRYVQKSGHNQLLQVQYEIKVV